MTTLNLRPSQRQDSTPTLDLGQQADALFELAQDAQITQTAVVDTTSIESQYVTAFEAQLDIKHDQAERIEDRLESLVEQQASRLQQTRSAQPGLMAMPGTRNKWRAQIQQQQSTLQRLEGRLEAVREIKDSMGVHSPRLEELATRKLRGEHPELAKEWDDMREAQRLHQQLMRKKEQEQKKQTLRFKGGDEASRHLGLGLSQTR